MDFYLMISEQKIYMVVIQCRINRSWKRSISPYVTHFHYICSNLDKFSTIRITIPISFSPLYYNKYYNFFFRINRRFWVFSKSSSSKYLFPLFCSSMSLVWFTLLRMTRWGRYRFQTTWQKLMKLALSVPIMTRPFTQGYNGLVNGRVLFLLVFNCIIYLNRFNDVIKNF